MIFSWAITPRWSVNRGESERARKMKKKNWRVKHTRRPLHKSSRPHIAFKYPKPSQSRFIVIMRAIIRDPAGLASYSQQTRPGISYCRRNHVMWPIAGQRSASSSTADQDIDGQSFFFFLHVWLEQLWLMYKQNEIEDIIILINVLSRHLFTLKNTL
jgi:hypothetical protein